MDTKTAPTSLADLKSGKTVPGDKDESPDKEVFSIVKPPWYDEERFQRGRDFFIKYRSCVLFSYLCAIMIGFSVDQLTNALIFTGVSVGPKKARKRYLHTLDNIIKWHTGGDIFDTKSVAGSSVLKVRHMHHYVRTAMLKKVYEEVEAAVEGYVPLLPDGELPMNQYDMALVQSAFVAEMILHPKEVGAKSTLKEFDDYTYFWRVIGWCLGIKDEYNMCGINATVTKAIFYEIQQEVVVPGLLNPSPHFKLLCGDFVKGMKPLIPGFNQPAMYKYLFPGLGLKPPTLSFFQWFYYLNMVVTLWLCYHLPVVRCFFNLLFKYLNKLQIWIYGAPGKDQTCHATNEQRGARPAMNY